MRSTRDVFTLFSLLAFLASPSGTAAAKKGREPAQHERNFEKAGLEERGTENGVPVVYLHSAGQSVPGGKSSAGAPPARTRLLLTPKFTPGDEITYAFMFRWTGLSPAAQ